MKINMKQLELCFRAAKETSCKYIAVKIQMQGFEKPEVIINEKENFETKLAYYKKAYNEDLTLKTFNGIKIVNFAFGSDLNFMFDYLKDTK